MSKIIGITVGTTINPEKVSNEKEIEEIKASLGDIGTALDDLHEYAQSLVTGGEA